MDVAIVYESLFGNTRSVAEAIADGYRGTRPEADVAVLDVHEASPDQVSQVDLLVVGGPTHTFHMTTPRTRRMSRQTAPVGRGTGDGIRETQEHTVAPGVREWLKVLPAAPTGAEAAAFDTRFGSPLAGGAARSISRQLRDHGYLIVTDPKGFIVTAGEGPLKSGERERARVWGVRLARLCSWGSLGDIPGREG